MEITDEEYQSERAEVLKKLETLNPPEMQDMAQAAVTVRTLGDAWPRATAQKERDIHRLVFDAVCVRLEKGTVTGLVLKPPFRIFFSDGIREDGLVRLWGAEEEETS